MAASEQLAAIDGPEPTPFTHTVRPLEALTPSVVNATFDGSGAAGAFLPCCSIYSQDGRLLSRTFPGQVAAGDVAEVTYGPFLKAPASVGAAATPPPGTGGTLWLTGGYSGAVHSPGNLLAYYRLGDAPNTLVDQIAPAVNLTKHAGATPGGNVPGPPQIADGDDAYTNQALATGTGDYFTLPDGIANKFAALSDWSISLWIWPSDQQPALNSGSTSINRAWIFADRVDTLGVRNGWALCADYALADGFGGANVGLALLPAGSDVFALGPFAVVGGGNSALPASWYHVAITHATATSATRMYVNGALVGTDISTGFGWVSALTGGSGYLLGAGFPIDLGSVNRQRGFVGTIDEVAIYGKVLSDSDVLTLYNGSGLDSDLGHWISTGYGSGAPVGTGAIDTAQLADSAVTAAKIAANAVTTAKIADGTIVAADISATLKPSGTAAAGTEALRALGTTASTAMAGNDVRLLGKTAPVYSAAITPNAASGEWQTITVTNATAFTINAPTNPPAATGTQEITIEILNSSGGAMGAVTWNAAFVLLGGAFTNPATTKRRYITFQWNGASWIEQNRAPVDY